MTVLYELRLVTPRSSSEGVRISTRRVDWGSKDKMLNRLRADPVRLFIHRMQETA